MKLAKDLCPGDKIVAEDNHTRTVCRSFGRGLLRGHITVWHRDHQGRGAAQYSELLPNTTVIQPEDL